MTTEELIEKLQAVDRVHRTSRVVVELDFEGQELQIPVLTVEYDHHTKKVILK